MKICTKCNVGKPIGEYHKDAGRNDGLSSRCKQCAKQMHQAWARANPEKRRGHKLKHRYGIDNVDYDNMVQQQRGRCDICNTKTKLAVDHCHVSGQVRALLCNACNVGLGHFNDNAELLRAAADYIRKHTHEKDSTN